MFISPFIRIIDFNGENYSTFTQRLLSAQLKDLNNQPVLMKGKPEFLVATGKQDPYQPFFFYANISLKKEILMPTH